ncbi:hypothetical protein Pcinc_037344, partial [Petrolisthes cinctipes]
IAGCLSNFCSFIIVPQYFTSRKGLATGFISTSSALGKIVMAPLLRLLLEEYGYKWACLIAGALSLNSCISGMLYHPPDWHKIPDQDEAKEVRVETGDGGGQVAQQQQQQQPQQQQQQQNTTTNTTPHPIGRTRRDNDDDEDIIFVMPTTQSPLPHGRHDDELVLFSRGSEEEGGGGGGGGGGQHGSAERSSSKEERIKMIKAGSLASISGSLPILAPLDFKVYDDDEDDPKQQSCLQSCFLVKPFLLLDYGLLREPNFHLIAWPGGLLIAGYLNLMYALPGYITSLGYTHYQGAFAISIFCFSEVVCRLPIAAVSDNAWFPVELGYVTGFVLTAVASGCISVTSSYTWILTWMVVLGVGLSLVSVLSIHVILKYLGVDRYAQASGFFSLNQGLNVAVIGFLAGLVRQYTNSYNTTFIFVTVILSLAAGVFRGETKLAGWGMECYHCHGTITAPPSVTCSQTSDRRKGTQMLLWHVKESSTQYIN